MSPKTLFTLAGAFVVVWAILGMMDVRSQSYSGYSSDFDNNVTQVEAGSPAEMAGMQVGDRVRVVNGVAVEDSRGMSVMPRARIGEMRTISVDRGGERSDLSLTYAAQPSSQTIGNYLFILVGLAFVAMGLWAFFTAPGRPTKLLAESGVFFGIALTGGPYLGASLLANLVGAIVFFSIAMAFATLLHFMLVFPDRPEPNKRWVYGPAVFMGLVILGLTLFQPDATSGLNRIVQLLFAVWIFGYLGLALFHMVRTWARSSVEERSRHGLTLLLVGTGLGLGLLLLSAFFGILFPRVTIPGNQWIGLSLVLVPIACALAAVRSGRAAGGVASGEAAAT